MPVFHIKFDILGESIKNKHFSIIIEEVSNSEAPQKYPQLSDGYNNFEKRNSNPNETWEEIEQAYYEMIAKEYAIVVY